jgi:hypothetical protein
VTEDRVPDAPLFFALSIQQVLRYLFFACYIHLGRDLFPSLRCRILSRMLKVGPVRFVNQD